MPIVEENLRFFNSLYATLEPGASEGPRLRAVFYDVDDIRELTAEELGRVVFEEPALRLCGTGGVVEHAAPDRARFRVRDLLDAIERTERVATASTPPLASSALLLGLERKGDVWHLRWRGRA